MKNKRCSIFRLVLLGVLVTALFFSAVPAFAATPDSIKVKIYQIDADDSETLYTDAAHPDGVFTIAAASGGGWHLAVDVPKYNAALEPYRYKVEEVPLDGYAASYLSQIDNSLDDYYFFVTNVEEPITLPPSILPPSNLPGTGDTGSLMGVVLLGISLLGLFLTGVLARRNDKLRDGKGTTR